MFQEAKWIIYIQEHELETAMPIMRKAFTVSGPVKKAELCICGLGLGVYYLNGQAVTEDVLTTPISNYDIKTYYNRYDVSAFLRPGENVLGAMLGNGWYNNPCKTWSFDAATWRDYPKLIAQLDVEYADGKRECIVSDASWRAKLGPVTYNHTRIGETFDARLEPAGWAEPGFDDGDWDNAKIWFGSGGKLIENYIEPVRRIRTIIPERRSGHVYSVGKNIAGWVKIRVRGKPGARVQITYGERITEDGRVDNAPESMFVQDVERPKGDVYILRGEGVEEWEPRFVYHGFAYFELAGDFEEITPTAVEAHTDLEQVGSFSCSDEMLNKIHEASVNSTLSNVMSIPTDCPHREQLGWTGDVAISAEQALMNFDIKTVYKRWLREFRDVQRSSGQLPVTVPLTPWRWRWFGGPAWDAAFFTVPYAIYNSTGDAEIIRENFDAMVRYLDFAYTISDHYIIDFFLGDHCPPEGCKKCGVDLTATAYYYTIAKTVAACARIIGRDAAPYMTLAENIKAAFRKAFIKDGRIQYDCQTAYACAIYHGLYEEDEIPSAIARLVELIREKGNHFDVGILGAKAMFSVLSQNGQAELLYQMVTNPTMPSYAYWINQGMTALGEFWNMRLSRNHHMYSEVDNWFYRYLAGIRLEAGKIIIEPVFLQGLDWVRAHHRDIHVFWDREHIEVSVPQAAVLVLGKTSIPLDKGTHRFRRDPVEKV